MSDSVEYVVTLRRLLGGERLSADESAALIGDMMDGSMSSPQAAAILTALAAKGEHADEIIGAARAMRERAVHVDHGLPLVVDVVGTGGDGRETINISTMAALVVAAAGVPVAKHGNRAASSACGSADVLEANGLPLDVKPEVSARMLREAGFAFMFAPRYHPAYKNVAPVRKELGIRTIFNLLGPLTNPANATHYLIGVARPEFVELIGNALQRLGVTAAAVVHGYGGIDEIAGDGPSEIYSFAVEGTRRWILDPAEFSVHATRDDVRGGSIERCSAAFNEILGGERSPRTDVVALNAAVALYIAGHARSVSAGFEIAKAILLNCQALEVFERAKIIARESGIAAQSHESAESIGSGNG